MNHYTYQNLRIKIFDDRSFTPGSDNIHTYLSYYYSQDEMDYHNLYHGVKIFDGDTEIDSCLLLGSGGTTGIHQTSSLLDGNQLLICCGDSLFCLTLPLLELKWSIQVDMATCFQVLKHQNDYLVHGEVEISRINRKGEIKWTFMGADIFVSIKGDESFTLQPNHIALIDFERNRYEIDFDGRLIWDSINYPKR
jgi:hypothetical protein